MKTLTSIFNNFENAMVAGTFAEAGEFDTAKQIMQEEEARPTKISRKSGSSYVTKIAVNSAVGSK
jgi:hypothetical protein